MMTKRVIDKINLAGVIRIQEQQELVRKHPDSFPQKMKDTVDNLHIALLWEITQE
ncbi:MAG: hypothetical protein K2M46_10600 [Lachnospiraceae bacterium]|nr:hypothetical protein [Lachnospiraceae bacterium]